MRERKGDIPLLIDHFLKRFGKEREIGISQQALDLLVNYHWPGNVRELKNVIQRASLFAEKEIKVSDLPDDYQNIDHIDLMVKACKSCFTNGGMPYQTVMQCLELRLFKEALESAGGNQSEAARKLGLKLSTFRDKLKKADSCNTENEYS